MDTTHERTGERSETSAERYAGTPSPADADGLLERSLQNVEILHDSLRVSYIDTNRDPQHPEPEFASLESSSLPQFQYSELHTVCALWPPVAADWKSVG